MRNTFVFLVLILSIATVFLIQRGTVFAAEATTSPDEKKIPLSLQAGRHDRLDVPVSVLVDAANARSVFVEYADGTLGRAQLVEPGLLNASLRGKGKKELHFMTPKMAKGETAKVIAALSERPVEGRTYVWSGEARQSRRVSCGQCHQGLALPTGEELRQERKVMDETGRPPPLQLPRIFPTSKGRDFRWHEKLERYQTSACWECHARHMVQYEFGQSLEGDLPWAPDPPQAASAPSPLTVRSVYHRVFRVKQGRAASHPLSGSDLSSDGAITWAIHYGFDRAMGNGRPCSGILQQHAGTLCEEAGKFIGRHCVRIDWVGNTRETRTAIAREERQLTVKDLRGRNGSYAMWIDFASTLSPAAGPMRIDDAGPLAGFRFVPSIDSGAVPEYRQSGHWRAITFVSEGSAYTAVCFNSPSNPKPLVEERADRNRDCGPTGLVEGIGYRFSAQLDERNPLLIHYRLWIQGGRMPSEEIQSMADDFVEPITIAVK